MRGIAKPPAHLLGSKWRPASERTKRRSAAFCARSYTAGFEYGITGVFDDDAGVVMRRSAPCPPRR